MSGSEFLELLARDAAPVEFEAPLLAARTAGAPPEVLAALEHDKALALQVRGVLESRRRREVELSALYETASDLTALTDLDALLTAIVRRARALLGSDLAYLSLNDDEQGDTYMRVTEGSTSAAFRQVRLPMGAGLGGLVAQTAMPYATPSYFEDERFRHTHGIDSAVADEGLVSILGVPLQLGSRVIGVLYAANRTEEPFSRADVALLVSLAAHAAIAIDNARLLQETQAALAELKVAGEQLRLRTASVERAADAHDQLTAVVVRGGGVEDVAAVVGQVLGGEVVVLDAVESVLAATGDDPPGADELALFREAVALSRTVERDGLAATPVLAGTEVLGVLGLRRAAPHDEADRRILERSALVTALLLLFSRSVAQAEGRVRGELLTDLLTPGRRDAADLRRRAGVLGADLDRPHCLVVAEATGHRERLSEAAGHLAAVSGGFAAVHRGRLVLLVPGEDPHAAAALAQQGLRPASPGPVTVGVSGPTAGPDDVAAAHDEARRVADSLVSLGRSGDCATAADLGFVGLLVGDQPDVPAFVRSVLGPVVAYDAERGTALVETLEAYFSNGGNLVRTKADLHVHVNTVTQRLDRIKQLLGEDWQAPERQLEVQLALRLHRLTAPLRS